MEIEEEGGGFRGQWVWRGVALVLALILIGLGLWALGGAIYQAWELFRNPDSIAHFARYFLETTKIDTLVPTGGVGLAHYVAWVTVVLLLLVLGKLGAWALGAGALLLNVGRKR